MENDTQKNSQKSDYLLPLAIVIAALLISGSWIYTTGLKNSAPGVGQAGNNLRNQAAAGADNNGGVIVVNPVSAADHIRGNPQAAVKIIEFSDLECPFCKMFHETMKRVMSDYKDKVAWIYREYPLDSLHSKARTAAEGAECAAELGGNEKFWAYVDKYFETTPSNNKIDLAQIPQIGVAVGLDKAKFEACLASNKYDQKINESIDDGTKAGLQGTPYSVIIARDGRKLSVNGAQPYEQLKVLIDEALK